MPVRGLVGAAETVLAAIWPTDLKRLAGTAPTGVTSFLQALSGVPISPSVCRTGGRKHGHTATVPRKRLRFLLVTSPFPHTKVRGFI